MNDSDDSNDEVVTLAHGAGAGSMRALIDDLAVSRFADEDEPAADEVGLAALDDGSVHPLESGDGSVVHTTDSHVVSPPVFPGGDVGRLAVAGTVNDLAVMGATDPLGLTCSLIVQEGYPMSKLESVFESMQTACEEAGVRITTGDTKVMRSDEVDGPVINTAGVGVVPPGGAVTDAGLSPGDAVIVSGTVGDHGIALLSEREGFGFGGDLESDVAPVNDLVRAAMDAGSVTAMKDPTRGGLATTLNEIAEKSGVGLELDEQSIPIDDAIASAGEVLGIDPLSVANEGKAVLGVDADDADAVLEAIRAHPTGSDAAIVGHATADHTGRVVLDTGFGRRYLSEPEGEVLPRIC
ncbi:hydrogenase expression/formation protein HypE [Natronobacterium gregoryi]|uniref:Hydrogenase expression/formation protein HypE n=2 Tax=Natronobacterium gregoryi TaxID=44930 RepID=L0AIS2_NATGS|nr:hydrogenase expression/formation protein HypE [Natronobacterium gregoryi]AFZ73344.1 hydrogenase expression/formation protein HypE [Natronobacterium gregoryi SP2]PLK18788.1 hydrogenase expression/formation protein HypE [Natronobacterium gregoryi SP2]SFJ63910.1 hydrogenase expression/formation protein HypE [Natronobacterium gregoryi]